MRLNSPYIWVEISTFREMIDVSCNTNSQSAVDTACSQRASLLVCRHWLNPFPLRTRKLQCLNP